jgi:hypothetical protein
MSIIIGSARHDEAGKYTNGYKGDQLQNNVPDVSGEVSFQNFYIHKKGWYILRPKSEDIAKRIASKMKAACNNRNIGYSQTDRLGVTKTGIDTNVPTNCDCSSLVRQCIKEASGIDPGNFTTMNEATILEKSGLFCTRVGYTSGANLYEGDVLVTKTKGHTIIVVEGNKRSENNVKYYPKPEHIYQSIVDALKSVGERDTTFNHRKAIAKANGITNYEGSVIQNRKMLELLNSGKLVKP